MVEAEVTTYRVYRTRWLQLFFYVLATLVNGALPITFVAVQSQTASLFSITSTQVNFLSAIPLFMYIPGTFLSAWSFERFSMRTVMIIGSLMNLGIWIRLFSLISPSNGYAWLILGQILPGVATPMFFNAAALFAARWFAPGQRDLATAIGSMANPLGIAIGCLFPSLVVTDTPSSQQFLIVFASKAAFATLIILVIFIGYQSGPPTPPSQTEEQQNTGIKQNLCGLITNYHFIILLFSFSIGLGLFNAINSLMYQLIQSSGYSSEDAGVCGAVVIGTGLISAGITGVIMDYTRFYKLILKVLAMGACASSIYFIVILRPSTFYPLAVSFGLMGFFLLPLLPTVFECAVECTYPIRPEWSTGVLLCVGNVLGGIFIFILDALIK